MDHFIFKMNDYLPMKFDDEENEVFRNYIKAAYIENLTNGKFQFAFLAFHLLFMTYVYKEFWTLKEFDYQKVKRFCDNNRQLADIHKIFDMSIISEKDAIDNAMSILGFHPNHKLIVKNFVDTRNNCAHASGIIQYTKSDIQYYMTKALEYTEKIHSKTKPHIQNQFCKEVKNYWEGDSFIYKLSVDFSIDFMKKFQLSPKEIEQIFEIDKNILFLNLGEEKKHSYEVSYYIIMSILQNQYIEKSSSYGLKVQDDWSYTNLKSFLDTLDENNRESIEIELEDELNAAKEKFGILGFDNFKNGKLAIA